MNKTVVKVTTSVLAVIMLMGSLPQPTTAANQAFESSTVQKYSKLKKWITQCQEINPDVKGWLIVPGTNINEPIVYNSKDNDYYVNRDWKGTNYPNNNWQNFHTTASYADSRTKWGSTWQSGSKNTVIYGHNWTNLRTPLDIGSNNRHLMFGQLPSYTDINFAQTNPYIYYSTGENEGIWKVFCVAYCELKDSFNYNKPNPNTKNGEYANLLAEWKARSMYNFDVDVGTSDRILTLSTCTRMYNMGENQRFVVVARLLREGESEKDAVSVSVNNNMKQPQF